MRSLEIEIKIIHIDDEALANWDIGYKTKEGGVSSVSGRTLTECLAQLPDKLYSLYLKDYNFEKWCDWENEKL